MAKKKKQQIIQNSLTDFAMGIQTQQNQISQSQTINLGLRHYMITNDRMLLSSLYCENGLVQTLIRQPIDDAYRDGIEIHTQQLNPDEIKELEKYIESFGALDEYIQARKWGRLFGGAGLVINTDQPPEKELNINLINEKSKVEFYAADRWELNYQASGQINNGIYTRGEALNDVPYNYYGTRLHKSRVLQVKGEEAPSILKLQLMGWGMSEVERLITSLNKHIKHKQATFEALDEYKVDVFKIMGFNSSLATAQGTDQIVKRTQTTNMVKNHFNAITIDGEDDYVQKQISFSGLAEIIQEIRQDIACDMRMPMSKLFGIGASGFSSGEDDLENYNSMIESEIRAKDKKNLIMIVQICCKKKFGILLDDLDITFKPLRVLTSEQDTAVKNSEFDRLQRSHEAGLITDEEFKEAINKNGLLPISIGAKQ